MLARKLLETPSLEMVLQLLIGCHFARSLRRLWCPASPTAISTMIGLTRTLVLLTHSRLLLSPDSLQLRALLFHFLRVLLLLLLQLELLLLLLDE